MAKHPNSLICKQIHIYKVWMHLVDAKSSKIHLLLLCMCVLVSTVCFKFSQNKLLCDLWTKKLGHVHNLKHNAIIPLVSCIRKDLLLSSTCIHSKINHICQYAGYYVKHFNQKNVTSFFNSYRSMKLEWLELTQNIQVIQWQ